MDGGNYGTAVFLHSVGSFIPFQTTLSFLNQPKARAVGEGNQWVIPTKFLVKKKLLVDWRT
jgi:hypothetical protein